MRCLSPRTVGFKSDGKTISWSKNNYSKEYATFQLPCSKCIECRLEYARQWAVRCVHEAQMHPDNIFLTLTYNEENLKSEKLQYIDFQLFVKRLRKHITSQFISAYGKSNFYSHDQEDRKKLLEPYQIGIFVTGEYGDQKKRPHWHAIIFNYRPKDSEFKYTSHSGDKVYTSPELSKLWGKGNIEYGSVTFESAGYVARYASKKLVHGEDDEHDYQPISKKSSKNAIGKKWLEKYWPDIFNYGHVILHGGQKSTIPRYYEKWLQKNHPAEWLEYVTKIKNEKILKAQKREQLEKEKTNEINNQRLQSGQLTHEITKNQVRKTIINQKFQNLQKHLKGDI